MTECMAPALCGCPICKVLGLDERKPAIHQSQMGMEAKCGEAFMRRYGDTFGIGPENEIRPPGVNMARGTATHLSVEHNMTHKIQTGKLAPLDECTDCARDGVINLFAGEVMLTDEEATRPKQTKDDAVQLAVDLSACHYRELAPGLEPVEVEKSFLIEMPRYQFDLAGRIDLVEKPCLTDVKTTGAVPTKDAAEKSFQLQLYSMATYAEDPTQPIKRARLDYLYQTPKKTKTYSIRQEIQPTIASFQPALSRIESFMKLIKAARAGHDVFSPADPAAWNCSPKWCGYANDCKFYMGDK